MFYKTPTKKEKEKIKNFFLLMGFEITDIIYEYDMVYLIPYGTYFYFYEKKEISPVLSIRNKIISLENIKRLEKLRSLLLVNTGIKEIGELSTLTELKLLSLSENYIEDISVIENFKSLNSLIISFNFIKDFTPILKLKELKYLRIDLYQKQTMNITIPEDIVVVVDTR